jgi:very-short-patch-repair endonuclease
MTDRRVFVCGEEGGQIDKGALIDLSDYAVLFIQDEPSLLQAADAALVLSRRKQLAVGNANDYIVKGSPATPVLVRAADLYFGSCESLEKLTIMAWACIENNPNYARVFWHFSGWLFGIYERCESPAEARLCVHLLARSMEIPGEIFSQHPVVAGCANYRADFAIVSYEGETPFKICVEVDGHDFHERTKEQAARDRARDRVMTLAGWRVMRFTGSEVWKNPESCAAQVADLAELLSYPEDDK